MIEALGQSPVSSVLTAGRQAFMSIFKNKASNAFGGEDSYRYPRGRVSARGSLVDKRCIGNINSTYYFQFNPQTISDTKETLYETRRYAGIPYNDYIWSGGGERVISFQLFLDDTPGSDSVNAWKILGGGGTVYANSSFKDQLVGGIKSAISSLKQSALPDKGPKSINWEITSGGYSETRIHERGILDSVEKIQAFLYPAPSINEFGEASVPQFATGGIVDTAQFRPPAVVIFSFGNIYMEGVIKSAPVQYTLFDKDLTPIRATIDVEFAVYEFRDLSKVKRELKEHINSLSYDESDVL